MPAVRAGARRRPSLLGLALLVLLALLGVGALKSHRELADAGERRDELVVRLAQAEARNAVLEDRIERLENDSHALEHQARGLGLARPGEIVWYYLDKESAEPPAGAVGATSAGQPRQGPISAPESWAGAPPPPAC